MNRKIQNPGKPFLFKQFQIFQDSCAMKVGTDGVLLGAWANTDQVKHALDIGTGTGIIAIMLAQRNTGIYVDGVEVEEKSSIQAKENMVASPFRERLEVYHTDIQSFAAITNNQYDLIVSNPPYFSGGTLSSALEKTTVRHTVKLSHDELIIAAKRLLRPKGKFCVILPFTEGLRLQELSEKLGLYCTKKTEVKSKREKTAERLLLEFQLEKQVMQVDELTILANVGRHDYTPEYVALVKEFYTIL
ncbi:MAG: tRNA1(Val) (adenine(37)-N6)-methyltransferase [Saprospiraceae bacterium]